MSTKEKTCFVVSPIGLPGSEVRQKADDFLQFIVAECDSISKYNYKVVRGDQINEPGRITTQVIRLIHSAELVIADVTGGNENVYYELALRHALGLPLITCAESGTVLPFDTRDNRTVFYSMHSRQAKLAREELAKQINAVNAEAFKPDNPIFEALKVIKLTESTDSSDRTLGLMLQKLDDLGGRMSAMEQRIIQASLFPGIGSGALSPFGHAGSGIIALGQRTDSFGGIAPTFTSGEVSGFAPLGSEVDNPLSPARLLTVPVQKK